MTPDFATVINELLGELGGLAGQDRAELVARLVAELPALLEIYARQRGLKLEAQRVVIVDERAKP